MKKYFKKIDKFNILFLILSFLFGVVWYRNDLPPRAFIRKYYQKLERRKDGFIIMLDKKKRFFWLQGQRRL